MPQHHPFVTPGGSDASIVRVASASWDLGGCQQVPRGARRVDARRAGVEANVEAKGVERGVLVGEPWVKYVFWGIGWIPLFLFRFL